MRIYIGSDHRGFALKEKIKKWLSQEGYEFNDLGAEDYDPKDDYTLFAQKVGVSVGREEGSMGVLICGSGVGVDVVANKIDGVRASIGKSPEQVTKGRGDDDMNILVLAADFTKDDEAREMLTRFLTTEFSGKERFIRRLKEVKKIEANN